MILRRLGWSLLVLWFIVSLAFALSYALPADPARALVGPHADAATVEQVRRRLCLDRGLLVAYGCHVGRLASGDLGESFRTGRPVRDLLVERAGPTAELAIAAVLIQLLVGVPLGILAALRRDRPADMAIGVVTAVGQSAPAFVVGPLFMVILGYGLGLFPVSGHGRPGLDRLWHLCLPALTLALAGVASYVRLVRAELVELLGEDYMRTARAKGLSRAAALVRHGLRNAIAPVLAFAGVDLGALLGGAVVTEVVFAWPGLGREAVTAILDVDLPVVLGVTLCGSVAVLAVNVAVDLVTAIVDPRRRGPG